jgi:hypothetical protein
MSWGGEQIMILKYGTYAHARNEPAVQIEKRALFSPRGNRRGTRETWRIAGILHGADPAGVTAALAALRTAYSTNGLDLGLYLDDGVTPTDHRLLSSATLGGTRVLALDFPVGAGAEYSTFRSYVLTVSGEIVDTSSELLDFSETLSFEGTGGPRIVFLETLTGVPQPQVTRQYTTCRARQEGRAVGLTTYPAFPAPLWPAAELPHERRLTLRSPRRIGANWSEYIAEWSYLFESVTPLSGSPTVE